MTAGRVLARFRALQFLVSKEHKLIQEILRQSIEIPLGEISVESDNLSGQILCGLIYTLPHGVDFLIGNDLQEEMPLHVALFTKARTYNTDRNAVVYPQTEANDSETHVHCTLQFDVKCGC